MKLSIITVNYNNALGLQKTIDSVVNQVSQNYEFIIIDGGSSDGSVEVIKKYDDKIHYWVSERDGGIYYGMNKGIVRATGEPLVFVTAGDYLRDSKVVKKINSFLLETDFVVFRQMYINKKRHLSISPRLFSSEIETGFFMSSVFPHQATLIKKTIFDRVGFYRTDLCIVSDWAFWFEAVIKYNATYHFYDYSISIMECGGLSSDIEKCQIEMSVVAKEMMDEGFLTWKDIFSLASNSRRCQFAERNWFSRFLFKIAIYFGKRI